MVTDVSCRQEGDSCPIWAGVFALISFVGVTVGVALLLAMVFRSLAEWRHPTD